MKRLTAIFFLCLLVFNIAGYRLWFYYAERQSTSHLMTVVEQEQYQQSELLTLEVSLSLPYQTDWADWEKVHGSIQVDGITYQYVQRKVEQGKLILQCLPNNQQAKIESARDRFFQLANSFQADHSGKKESPGNTVKLTKPSLTDYDNHWTCWGILNCLQQTSERIISEQSLLPDHFLPIQGQPPEWIG